MLKESYSNLVFPLEKNEPEFIGAKYLSEFGISQVDSGKQIELVFSHALRDYLIGRIDEDALGSLSFFFVSDKRMYSFIVPNSDLDKFISECADISWLSKSDTFNAYKLRLQNFLDSISQKN